MFYPVIAGIQPFCFFSSIISLGAFCVAFHVLLGFPQGDRDTFVGILDPPHQPSPAETFDLLALGHNGFIVTLLILIPLSGLELASNDSCIHRRYLPFNIFVYLQIRFLGVCPMEINRFHACLAPGAASDDFHVQIVYLLMGAAVVRARDLTFRGNIRTPYNPNKGSEAARVPWEGS